mmetsp:Transcript_9905/g.24093  ORF Transcript_9905/g.24093 Transcript_9905/m.24093 type:complete len:248 (+) Transcript_9905:149-892(+)
MRVPGQPQDRSRVGIVVRRRRLLLADAQGPGHRPDRTTPNLPARRAGSPSAGPRQRRQCIIIIIIVRRSNNGVRAVFQGMGLPQVRHPGHEPDLHPRGSVGPPPAHRRVGQHVRDGTASRSPRNSPRRRKRKRRGRRCSRGRALLQAAGPRSRDRGDPGQLLRVPGMDSGLLRQPASGTHRDGRRAVAEGYRRPDDGGHHHDDDEKLRKAPARGAMCDKHRAPPHSRFSPPHSFVVPTQTSRPTNTA